jgi:hypothetical protein
MLGREARVSSQATSKAAPEETRDRAERVSAVGGSDQATVVAEEDTLASTARRDPKQKRQKART